MEAALPALKLLSEDYHGIHLIEAHRIEVFGEVLLNAY
jgi:hypothetical protein